MVTKRGVASGSACGRTGHAVFDRSSRVLGVPAVDAEASPNASARGATLTAV
ncbi:hypothetical protein ACTXJX_16765 [Glutamicibacter ardleyensis]|uniref:hypothetical protein n=1 Tax=Glutamicibacter ardleyensis TaxID=225894 RepID=UPI003FD17C64